MVQGESCGREGRFSWPLLTLYSLRGGGMSAWVVRGHSGSGVVGK